MLGYSGYGKKDQDALEYVDERVNIATDERVRGPLESYWDSCASFYEGSYNLPEHQGSLLNGSWNQFFDNETLSENRILPMVQRAVSTILTGNPQVVGVPEGPAFEHRRAARVAKEGYEEFVKRHRMDAKWRKAVRLAIITGTSIVKTCWDPSMGEAGDVRSEVFSSWDFWMDHYADHIDEASWASTATVVGLERAQAMYPDLAEELEKRAIPLGDTWLRRNRLFQGSGGRGGFYGSNDTKRHSKGLVITDFWGRPSHTFKDGLRMLTAGKPGDRLKLHKGLKNPYVGMSDDGFMELPFDPIHWMEATESFWSISMVGQLMGLQMELDRNTQDLAKIRKRFAHPRGVVGENSPYAKGFPTDMDEVLVHSTEHGAPPQYLTPPPVPELVWRQRDTILEAMGTVAAQSEASQAQNPDGVRTGVALEALIERDQSVYAPRRKEVLEAMSNQARRWMLLCQEYQDADQIIRRVGKDAGVSISTFKGADLKGCSNIVFILDESAGLSKADKRRWLEERLNLGLLDPSNPEHRSIISRTIEDGTIEEANADFNIPRDRAERVLEQMIDPENDVFSPVIEDDEDFETWWLIFSRFKGRPAFDDLDPDKQKAIRDVLGMIAMKLQQQQMAQMEMQMAAQAMSGPPQGAGGSPPKEPGMPSPPKQPMSHDQQIEANQLGGMR